MANGHGGQRTPNNPAPTSGPGALSRRTDGGPTSQPPMVASGGPYGSRQDQLAIQAGAPLAGGGAGATPARAAMPGPPPVPFDAPTQRPDEPVTAGAGSYQATGATQIDDATRQKMLGALPTLLWLASQPQASEQTRQFVRSLRADL